MLGGIGRRGRKSQTDLDIGDALDFGGLFMPIKNIKSYYYTQRCVYQVKLGLNSK